MRLLVWLLARSYTLTVIVKGLGLDEPPPMLSKAFCKCHLIRVFSSCCALYLNLSASVMTYSSVKCQSLLEFRAIFHYHRVKQFTCSIPIQSHLFPCFTQESNLYILLVFLSNTEKRGATAKRYPIKCP